MKKLIIVFITMALICPIFADYLVTVQNGDQALFMQPVSVELTAELTAHPGDAYEIGTAWCKAQCRDLLAHGVEEIHFYTMGRSENIINVLKDCF